MQLSKLENEAYENLKRNKLEIFRVKDLRLILGISETKTYNIVKSLKKKGVVKSAGKGFLAFKDVDEFVVGTRINYPSYISFWSALSYYGFSDQMPKKIFLVTTKYAGDIENYKFVTLSRKRFFGYVSVGDVVIADKEKALIDSLLFPKYSGGVKEIIRCVGSALNEIELKKLVDYAFKVESKAVLRRLGFILEKIEYKGKLLNKIRKQIGKGYELLDPELKGKNNLNERWLLDVNY
ncbi:MAG: hypothetical protein ABIG28_02245 [archaeon]